LREGYSADGYGLTFHGKAVDLSLPFRLSALPSNAALEMVEVNTNVGGVEVEIALQVCGNWR